MSTLGPAAQNLALQPSVPSRLVFDVRAEHPQIVEALAKASPELPSVLETLSEKLPVPGSASIDAEKQFYRLPTHNRSYCYALSAGPDLYAAPAIVFKGVEPLFTDFGKFIDWLLIAPFRKSSRVMADHFPLAEGKIPGALSLKEARREAALAAELQLAHLRAYGELARLPTPLLVHHFADDDAARVTSLLRSKLAPASFEKIEPLLAGGLGVYAYAYPVAPVRANAYGSGGTPRLSEYIKRHVVAEETTARWLQLLARLLYLGYLPYTPRNDGLGACMDFGNASLDGGFCDLDSIEPMSQCPDDEFFFESLIASVTEMAETVTRLASPTSGLESFDLYPSIERFAVSRYVGDALRHALETEARPGLTLDRRVTELLLSPMSLSTLTRVLQRRARPRSYALFLRQQAMRR